MVEPILRYIGHFGVVSSFHLLYQFWAYKGKSPVYGWRLLRKMESGGLIIREDVDPDAGNRSQHFLMLTHRGWERIGSPCPNQFKGVPRRPLLEYYLQYSEMALQRGRQGWQAIREDARFRALKAYGLSAYRNRPLSDSEILQRGALDRLPEQNISNPLWVHPKDRELRVCVPVIEGRTPGHSIRGLPAPEAFQELHFELVGTHEETMVKTIEMLRRRETEWGVKVGLHRTTPFRSRPNPRIAPRR